MENIQEKAIIKDSKLRSRLYPRYNIEEAIKLIQVVSGLGRKNVSEKSVAAETGKSITNSGFIGRVSSARQFALISKDGGKISLTQLGNEIMFPVDDTSKAEAIKRAFSMPTLYKELIDAFGGTKIPEHSSLGNRLLNDYGIEAGAKDVAAKNFIKSAEYAGVMQNGILIVENEVIGQDLTGQELTNDEAGIVSATKGAKNQPIRNNDHVFEFSGGMKLVIPNSKEASDALLEGELKEVKKLLADFAEKFIAKTNNIDEE